MFLENVLLYILRLKVSDTFCVASIRLCFACNWFFNPFIAVQTTSNKNPYRKSVILLYASTLFCTCCFAASDREPSRLIPPPSIRTASYTCSVMRLFRSFPLASQRQEGYLAEPAAYIVFRCKNRACGHLVNVSCLEQ